MGTIISSGDNFILTIPKSLISDKQIQKLMDLLRFQSLIEKSELTQSKGWELSEMVKERWWEENKARIFAKING